MAATAYLAGKAYIFFDTHSSKFYLECPHVYARMFHNPPQTFTHNHILDMNIWVDSVNLFLVNLFIVLNLRDNLFFLTCDEEAMAYQTYNFFLILLNSYKSYIF